MIRRRKLGKPIAARIIAEREGRAAGDKGEFGEDCIHEAGVPPFIKEVPEPVAGD